MSPVSQYVQVFAAALSAAEYLPPVGTPRGWHKSKLKGRKMSDQDKKQEPETEQVFRALGDPWRLRILYDLREKDYTAGELLERVDIVQSTLSHHMKVLCEAGLVGAVRKGKWTQYSLQRDTFARTAAWLESWTGDNAGDRSLQEESDTPVLSSPEEESLTSSNDQKRPKKKEKKKRPVAGPGGRTEKRSPAASGGKVKKDKKKKQKKGKDRKKQK